jgi:hypothetical protein
MLKGNTLKFQRGTATKMEGEDRNTVERIVTVSWTVRQARKIASLSGLWKFEQAHPCYNVVFSGAPLADAGHVPTALRPPGQLGW